jgi:beta-1,4-mannosyl-glycoprotein beta-1,4-N-acetylglucosaminyltransferase
VCKKDKTHDTSSPPWQIEKGQRNYLMSYLNLLNADDLAIICDVDEIWNPNLARFIKSGKISHQNE